MLLFCLFCVFCVLQVPQAVSEFGLLEKSSESTLYSIPKFIERMVEEYEEDVVYSCKHLKRKLLEQYGKHIFAEVFGRKEEGCCVSARCGWLYFE